MPIDQQTRHRMARTGLTALDEALACPGYVLYAPMFGRGNVYLLDLHGQEVHQWQLPYPPGLYGYLLPNGNLFYLGKLHDETWDRFPSWHRFKGGVLLEVDWHGNIVWEYHDPNHHHDARRTPSGGAIYLAIERIHDSVRARVQGGVRDSAPQGMWGDVLVEIDATGHRLWDLQVSVWRCPNRDGLPRAQRAFGGSTCRSPRAPVQSRPGRWCASWRSARLPASHPQPKVPHAADRAIGHSGCQS
jgi:hypothetical protein